ncbi:lipase chaperone [Rhizobacter sp. J219]|uniref:lipase chaperone n=1 Tax=Rhizobacter sp. J219 TaxID=2898430 RepID=UPI002151DADC|nr:lipase chaperone [Rhizobacter sp. J219]MCR5884446.1 lipase chaperone [Rhizobacter sp. J219]
MTRAAASPGAAAPARLDPHPPRERSADGRLLHPVLGGRRQRRGARRRCVVPGAPVRRRPRPRPFAGRSARPQRAPGRRDAARRGGRHRGHTTARPARRQPVHRRRARAPGRQRQDPAGARQLAGTRGPRPAACTARTAPARRTAAAGRRAGLAAAAALRRLPRGRARDAARAEGTRRRAATRAARQDHGAAPPSFRHSDGAKIFGVQEARALYASEVARIFADTSLTETQQAQRLFALRMGLPPEVAAQEFAGTEFSVAMERIAAQMRDEGESDDEVVFRRRQFVDVEGAKSPVELEREQLDTRRQAWSLRHPAFVRQRDALFAAHPFDSPERAALLDELLQQHFQGEQLHEARSLGLH